MKVRNRSQAVVWIGDRAIKPDETAELSKEELKMSGVKALIESGELEVVKESKQSKKEKKEE